MRISQLQCNRCKVRVDYDANPATIVDAPKGWVCLSIGVAAHDSLQHLCTDCHLELIAFMDELSGATRLEPSGQAKVAELKAAREEARRNWSIPPVSIRVQHAVNATLALPEWDDEKVSVFLETHTDNELMHTKGIGERGCKELRAWGAHYLEKAMQQ